MCDTFIVMPASTGDGSVLFGKNSDREPNEAQALEYHPAAAYSGGDAVGCTYIRVPQVRETFATLISRPFWMWGAEMGANEKGVVIGNEAVFTKMPRDSEGGLTGMDLLRLALERSDTADRALEVMVQLLKDHGQGGGCGYKNRDLVYHNSYIIADPGRAWVLETAGPLWAAARVHERYSISNGLTIGESFDESHPDLIAVARRKGWLKKGVTFHFARCYSDWFYTTFSASRKRRSRSVNLLTRSADTSGPGLAMRILRDHGPDPEYRPGAHFLLDRLCAHAANALTRDAAQTTGSLIAHLKPDQQTFWAIGTSAPCTGIFKPVWIGNHGLPDIGPEPGAVYNAQCLWWLHENLHRLVIEDYGSRISIYAKERDALERRFMEQAENADSTDRGEISRAAFDEARQKTLQWIERVGKSNINRRENLVFRRYWEKQNRLVL
ncbi:MAG: C69 family dipeptidase [Deltaproteobacteria bacterium]|nr:C69 family dipeptidase [Deltaproteobacteria bacterium]MBW2612462.1 C69 family dipeptidase [Deltaproteobacteria bacterium]MBW2676346.1 C69 family dipeptidase [Deltaproteobacteria bacterium]